VTQTLVMIRNEEGPPSTYIRYSARLPQFLERFPLEKGYRVECQATDFLSLAPGLLELLRELIRSGVKPSDSGIPNIEPLLTTLVCTSRLYGPDSAAPLRTASALAAILEPKDYEALETAANQRLLAALDIGGTIFDQDEDHDALRAPAERSGNASRLNGAGPSELAPPAVNSASSPQTGSASPARSTSRPTPDPAAASAQAPRASAAAPSEAEATRVMAATPKTANAPRNAQLVQIRTLATRLGESMRTVETKEAADAELARLGQLQAERQRQERESRARDGARS
jgi:hypothetical protein